ncbi:MAG: GIY-YIG nuclease family protein [Terrimesophilobacter sp.]
MPYSTMPFVYILRCSDNSYYVGSTRDIDSRLAQHNSGHGATYTSTRIPVELVFCAEFDDVGDAYAMEKRIQGWSRRKREALIAGDFPALTSASARKSVYRRAD